MKVLAINGSLRAGSFNRALLRAAQRVAPAGMDVHIVDLHGIPLYNRDEERESGFPHSVVELRQAVQAADALLVATPEYNYSIPGVLKNAWDWMSRPPDAPINDMPLAIVGAGGRSGTIRAQLHLHDIAIHNRLRIIPTPQVAVQVSGDAFDETPELVDERAVDQISRLLVALQIEAQRS